MFSACLLGRRQQSKTSHYPASNFLYCSLLKVSMSLERQIFSRADFCAYSSSLQQTHGILILGNWLAWYIMIINLKLTLMAIQLLEPRSKRSHVWEHLKQRFFSSDPSKASYLLNQLILLSSYTTQYNALKSRTYFS